MSTASHPNSHVQQRQLAEARHAAWVGIIASGLLGAVKIVAGWLGNSNAVIADGVESASDTIASGVVLFGMKVASLPPDEEHPYGHARAEDIAGKTIATMMAVSGAFLLWTNIQGLMALLQDPETHYRPASYTAWIMVIALLVKGWLFLYKLRVAKRLHSMALRSDAWNDFTDVISAIAVLLGLVCTFAGIPWADRAGAIVVSGLIIYTGLRISSETSAALMDQQAPRDVLKEIRNAALSIEGVQGVEKLLARRAGLTYFVDLHLEVDGAMSVQDAHELGHRVKAQILQRLPEISDVLVHLEPARKKTQ